MARYKLAEDHYRDGQYFRAGEYIVVEKGGLKPPKSSKLVKDAAPDDEEISEAGSVETMSQLGAQEPTPPSGDDKGAKGKGSRPNDKSPV